MGKGKKKYYKHQVKEIIDKLNLSRPLREETIIQKVLKLGYISFDRKKLINELRKRGLVL